MTCHSGGTLEIYVEPYPAEAAAGPGGPRPRDRGARHPRPRRRHSVVPLHDAPGAGTPRRARARTARVGRGRPPTRTPTRTRSSACCARRPATSAWSASRKRTAAILGRSASAAWPPIASVASRRPPASTSAPSRPRRSPSASWPRSSSTTAVTSTLEARARGRDCHADGSHRSDLRHDGRDRHRPPSLGGRRAHDVFLLCRLQGDVRTGELIYCRALFGALAPPPRPASAATSSRSVARSCMVRASAVSITSRAASGASGPACCRLIPK